MFPISARPRRWQRPAGAGNLVLFRSWPRRHWGLTSVAVLVLVGGPLAGWQPWRVPSLCGPGLSEVVATSTCVGLDLDSTPLQLGNDPLGPLEQQVGTLDKGVSGGFATIVMLENMTPNPRSDTITSALVRKDIEGTIIAVQQANATSIADGQNPEIKLLLANLGSDAASEQTAVHAIEAAAASQNISAVTGIEQSLDITRAAVTDLSDHGILTVGAVPTADDMRLSVDPGQASAVLPYYYQVSPTNTEEVEAAVNYIRGDTDQQGLPYQRVLMVADQNADDDYARTLQAAFTDHKASLDVPAAARSLFYDSDPRLAPGLSRAADVKNQFSQFAFHGQLCQDQPDIVYFAGRSYDLQQFIDALEGAQPCPDPLASLDVLTGDDGSNLVGLPLALDSPIRIRLFYTGLAAPDEWRRLAPGADNPNSGYQSFRVAFVKAGFNPTDMDDGDATMQYDAVLTAATAIHRNASAGQKPNAVVLEFNYMGCTQRISGASGLIAYTDSSAHAPYDKAMPIMRIASGGQASQAGLAWPTGAPLNPDNPC